jgi:hypothetical protein
VFVQADHLFGVGTHWITKQDSVRIATLGHASVTATTDRCFDARPKGISHIVMWQRQREAVIPEIMARVRFTTRPSAPTWSSCPSGRIRKHGAILLAYWYSMDRCKSEVSDGRVWSSI